MTSSLNLDTLPFFGLLQDYPVSTKSDTKLSVSKSGSDSGDTSTESVFDFWLDTIAAAMFFAFAMFVFGVNILRTLQSSDTGWLAKTGEYILLNHHLPASDIFSFTLPDRGWTVYQWLYMLFAGALLHSGGLWLVGLSAAVMCSLVFVWMLPSQMLKQNVRLPYIFGLLALVVTPAFFWARPQLISFLLIPTFINVLERFRATGSIRKLWSLPLLMVIWVNGHSFWFIGLLIMASYLIPAIIKSDDSATKKKLGLVMAACLGAVLINPYGFGIVSYNLSFLTEPDFAGIDELQPQMITLWRENGQAWLYFIVTWVCLIIQRKHIPQSGFVLALCGTLAAFRFFRFVPVGVLLTWPFLAIALGKFSATMKEGDEFSRLFKSPALPTFALLFSALMYVYWYPVDKPTWFVHSWSNQDAVSILKKHPQLRAGLLCDAAVGCSLIVEGLDPVFIDTRFDFYGKKFCDDFVATMRAQNDWRAYMKKWNVKSICLCDKYPLNIQMKASPDWLLVFDDGLNSIWLPNTAEGRKLFETVRLTPGCEELRAMKPKVQEKVAKNLANKGVTDGQALLVRGEQGRALEEFRRAKQWQPQSEIASRYVKQLSEAGQKLQ